MKMSGQAWRRAIRSIVIAALAAAPHVAAQAQQASVSIGATDIGGVVTGASGPEAGVWVIAETTELPTKYAKIVVTDDQGRYVIPDLPKANYSVWVRGYGLVDSPKVQAAPGKLLDLKAAPAPNASAAAQIYPPIYWFSMIHVPKKDEFPLPKIKSQGEWLNIVKSGACQSCHPMGTPGTRTISQEFSESVPERVRCLGAAACLRQRAGVHGARHRPARYPEGARPVRRLDRPDQGRRTAVRQARAAAGHRTQSGHHAVGLGPSDILSARRDLDRPAQSAAQRQRQDLRLAGGQHRHDPDPRSGHQHRERGQASGPRSEDAEHQGQPVRGVALLGRQADLGRPDHQSQRHDGREGPRLVDAAHPAARQSGVLQGRLRSSVGEGLPARRRPTASCRSTIRRPTSSR